MGGFRSHVLFKSIAVISGRWVGDTERLFAMEMIPVPAGLEPETTRSASQRLAY